MLMKTSGLVNVIDVDDGSHVVVANLIATLIIAPMDGDPKKVVLKEGATVTNLTYMAGCKEVTIESGLIKQIQFTYTPVEPKMIPGCECDEVSTFDDEFKPTAMIIDCSTDGDSIIRTVKFDSIIDCSVEETVGDEGTAEDGTEETP